MPRRTIINVDFVGAACHDVLVVPQSQLAKRGQTCSAHPDMKLFKGVKVGQGKACVVGGISQTPVWRRRDLVDRVGSVLVQIFVAGPGDTLVGHLIGRVVVAGALRIEEDGTEEGVIEEGIGNEATGVICLVRDGVDAQRIAVAGPDAVVAPEVTAELGLVERLDVSSVVLIEVCEAVVQKDVRADIVGNVEAQLANVCDDGSLSVEAICDGGLVARPGGSRGSRCAVFEVTRDMAVRDGREIGI